MRLLKPILAGILIGAALFYMPFFILRVLVVVLIVGAIFRLFSRRGFRGGRSFYPAFADNIRNMSDEEYKAFKQNPGGYCGWNNNKTTNENNENK